jgi:hypothetical protein
LAKKCSVPEQRWSHGLEFFLFWRLIKARLLKASRLYSVFIQSENFSKKSDLFEKSILDLFRKCFKNLTNLPTSLVAGEGLVASMFYGVKNTVVF